MSDDLPVILSPEAEEDLGRMGRLTRRLVNQALNDELRTSVPSLLEEDTSDQGWEALPIGNYRILFRSVDPAGEEGTVRLVGRIVDEEEDTQVSAGPPSAQQQSPAQSA